MEQIYTKKMDKANQLVRKVDDSKKQFKKFLAIL